MAEEKYKQITYMDMKKDEEVNIAFGTWQSGVKGVGDLLNIPESMRQR